MEHFTDEELLLSIVNDPFFQMLVARDMGDEYTVKIYFEKDLIVFSNDEKEVKSSIKKLLEMFKKEVYTIQ